MKKHFLTLSMLVASITIFAQGITFEHGTWSEVLAKAKQSNKLVFVDIYTTWCGPCKMMSNEVFPLENVGKQFNTNFVNYKIDAEKGEGIEIARKYEVQAYPTYLYVNGDGELVFRSVGSMIAEKFIEESNLALKAKDSKTIEYFKSKFEANKNDTKFLAEYIDKLKSIDANTSEIAYQYIMVLGENEKISQKSFDLIKSNMKESVQLDNALFLNII